MTERDLRSELLDTLLTTPHRKLAALHPVHQRMIDGDPLFYVHMAAWYAEHGRVRDHQEMFALMLCLSTFEGHREVGLALLGALPPYQVARVVEFVKRGLGRNVPRSMRTEVTRYLRQREADPDRFDRAAVTAKSALKRLYAGLHIRPSERAQAVLFDGQPPGGSGQGGGHRADPGRAGADHR